MSVRKTSFGPVVAEFRRVFDVFRARVDPDYRHEQDTARSMTFDMDPEFLEIFEATKRFTLTTMPRMYSLYEATKFVVENKIRGDIVECGVWRGGSVMLICRTLLSLGVTDRRIFLYDTFEGMSRPTEKDVTWTNKNAMDLWIKHYDGERCNWTYSDIDEVRRNVASTRYPENELHFVKGKVEDTLPGCIPEEISILRLDTDFYESTRHELIHLFPRLVSGGILAIDDYGSYRGCREAVDEYFDENNVAMLLNRVDASGYRIGIKK